MAGIQNEVIEKFKSQVRGKVLLPGEPGFDTARTVWNAMIDRKPGLIVWCAGVADVIRSVVLARDHDLLLSVRGGGHNIAGNAVCDDGLMIDLSAMKSVRVNPETCRAYVEPGATLADFDHEAQTFGLATPLGINSTTGVAGLTLGGGFGWLTRKYGLSIDNLLSADVITAEGKLVRANAQENPDLFWAIRGGGGNFGVVTLFEFQLHPVGPDVLSGIIVFPFTQAKTLLVKYREFVDQISEDLNVWVILRQAPPLPFLPAEVHGKEVVVFPFLYVGDIEAGMRAIEPLRSFGQPHGEHIGSQPYTAWQKTFDPLLIAGVRNYWKSHNFSELSDNAIDSMIEYAAKLPTSQCELFIGLLSGQANRVPKDATAYAQRDTKFVLNAHSRWEKREDDKTCISWAREFSNATAPYATGGVYVNFLTQDEANRIPAAYGSNYQRLVQLKRKYDPTNLFRLNQNIKPVA
ncbi:MAG: FAD-binding oxidoreductase [Candidatus Brocadia sp.]|nr:FAD-binding oxidoreductase [Candidatus Brocadia sp.]